MIHPIPTVVLSSQIVTHAQQDIKEYLNQRGAGVYQGEVKRGERVGERERERAGPEGERVGKNEGKRVGGKRPEGTLEKL